MSVPSVYTHVVVCVPVCTVCKGDEHINLYVINTQYKTRNVGNTHCYQHGAMSEIALVMALTDDRQHNPNNNGYQDNPQLRERERERERERVSE